ncbi:hypothetical protein OZX56_08995 [Lactobacillus sp. ESL0684]|uniref:hypothetical protein n=1 Tax=unclassified Lactobacillus TaxID=2620435 RepID=UPI0023F86D86|nr:MULTISPECIES: hypothetical protein [unclassified Lactobacillus]WEV39853.1 hypothetical protein OZX59_06485 [Lactobacillus sp. ESL0681]WEV43622.1 hypothetical protein OZX56_08995 [Lactobacillus sp. ESL0684]
MMSKKKITLNEKVEKLTQKYLQVSGLDLDKVTNQALEAFLVEHLNSSQIKEALQDTDSGDSKYTEQLFQSTLDHLNRF